MGVTEGSDGFVDFSDLSLAWFPEAIKTTGVAGRLGVSDGGDGFVDFLDLSLAWFPEAINRPIPGTARRFG